MQREFHLRITLHESTDHRRQDVTGLRVGGRNRQTALRLAAELVSNLPEIAHVTQHALGNGEHLPSRLGDVHQALAVAHEDFDAQFGFELPDLLRHPRLRGEQGLGRFRDVQPAAGDFVYVAQLLQVHGGRANRDNGFIITKSYFCLT